MAKLFLKKKINKLTRAWRKKLRKQSTRAYLSVGVLVLGLFSYIGYISTMNHSINTAVYKPLLHLIAEAESNGNYNAYYGNPENQSVVFTDMTVQEVMDWQAGFIAQGSPSSAVGRYQIIDTTLHGLVRELNLDTSLKFDQELQDRLAVTLLERRGANEYVRDELTAEEFAANLAKEWAALPKVVGENPEHSYYTGDGLNQSRISRDQILSTIAMID